MALAGGGGGEQEASHPPCPEVDREEGEAAEDPPKGEVQKEAVLYTKDYETYLRR